MLIWYWVNSESRTRLFIWSSRNFLGDHLPATLNGFSVIWLNSTSKNFSFASFHYNHVLLTTFSVSCQQLLVSHSWSSTASSTSPQQPPSPFTRLSPENPSKSTFASRIIIQQIFLKCFFSCPHYHSPIPHKLCHLLHEQQLYIELVKKHSAARRRGLTTCSSESI